MFNVKNAYPVNQTFTLMLTLPDGEPMTDDTGKQLSVTLYGPASKQQARAMAVKNAAMRDKWGKKGKSLDTRDADAEFLAECTASFNGFGIDELTGYDLFKAFYLDLENGHVTAQVSAAVSDWANFMKEPATA